MFKIDNKIFPVMVIVFGTLMIMVFVMSQQQYTQAQGYQEPVYYNTYQETVKKCGNPNSDHIKSIDELLEIKACSEKEHGRIAPIVDKLYADRTKAIETIPGDYYKSISKEIEIAIDNSSGVWSVVSDSKEKIAEMEEEIKLKEMKVADAALLAGTSEEIVMINLNDASNNPIIKGMKTYQLESINTNIESLKGIEFGSSYLKSASIIDNSINLHGAVKIPDPVNPNAVSVQDINIRLSVESIETSPTDGLKNYTGSSGFMSNSIGPVDVKTGELIQKSDTTSQLILYTN